MSHIQPIQLAAAAAGTLTLRSSVGASIEVDRENRVIRGVSVITAGATKTSANGIPSFQVDATTLSQVAADINGATSGVKGHVTHPSVEDRDGIEVLAGHWRNARVDGGRVVADFHVGRFAEHSPTGANLAEFLFSLAEEAPAHAGTSISAGQIAFDGTGPTRALRLAGHLTSIDWTGEPAANPLGMFSAAPNEHQTTGASLAVASPALPAERATAMKWTEAQITWLRSNGLDETATEAQVNELLANLGPEAKEIFSELGKSATASNPKGMPGASKVTVRDAQPSTGGSGSVNVSAAHEPAVTLATLTELNEIAQLAGMPGEWVTEMALSGRSPAEARKLALAARKGGRAPIQMGTPTPDIRVGEDLNLASLAQGVQDAIALRAGAPLYQFESSGSPSQVGGSIVLGADRRPIARKEHERASQFRYRRIVDIAREYLVALGVHRAKSWSPSDVASVALNRARFQAALRMSGKGDLALSHGTGDFPYLLADSMGKSLRAAYVAVPATWPFWCARRSAADFKDIKSLQLAEAPALDLMAHGEEYTFGTVAESRETYSLGKYGKGLSFTYESMINDDLDAFSRIPAAMGRAAQRTEETVAIAILTANAALADGAALFSSTHANLSTGALSATAGATSIGAARAKIMSQAPLGGTTAQPLGIAPKVLLVPAALGTVAQQLVSSTHDPASISGGLPMPAFIRQMMVLESALLDATSTTQFYAIVDPADMPAIEFAQLEGEEGPSVREDTNLSNDTIQLTVRHYCAAKAVDYRPICRSSGA